MTHTCHTSKTEHDTRKSDPGKQLYSLSKFHKNNVEGLKMEKKCQKVAFFCISYVKHPYKGRFTKTLLTIPLNLTSYEQTKVFLNLQTHVLITK